MGGKTVNISDLLEQIPLAIFLLCHKSLCSLWSMMIHGCLWSMCHAQIRIVCLSMIFFCRTF